MKKSQKKALVVGTGIATLATIATGVYLLTGKNAKNRQKLAKWAKDMQKDVVSELGQVQKASKANYHKIIDSVSKNYKNLKNVSTSDLAELTADLKSSWDHISSELQKAGSNVKKVLPKASVKKTAKKVPVKVVKKATKKTVTKVAKKKPVKRKS